MRFAVVVGNIPNPTTGGGALTAWSVIKGLTLLGHTGIVCLIEDLNLSPSRRAAKVQLDALSELGVKIVSVGSHPPIQATKSSLDKFLVMLKPRLQDYYPTTALAEKIQSILLAESPQAIFVYHFEPLAAVYQARVAPVFAGVGDPTHLPIYYRWRASPLRLNRECTGSTVAMIGAMVHLPGYMRAMMSNCAVSGAFAAHHAAWFRKIGISGCQYLHTPVVDNAGSDWEEKRRHFQNKTKFKVLLIGHLKGTATLSGMYLFARDVLPILERQLGPEEMEIHIVGGYSAPDELRRLLDRPCVKMRGQIEPADEEFLSCDVLVVPTPIKLGIRVRIITGFSFACCVVAHQANALGIPEMVDNRNALLSRDGKSMAEAILTALENHSLRQRLGWQARKTYEESFSLSAAGGRIVTEMERIAKG